MKKRLTALVIACVLSLSMIGSANALTIDTITGNSVNTIYGWPTVAQSFTVDSVENYFENAKFLFSSGAANLVGSSFNVSIKSAPLASESLFTTQITPEWIGNSLFGVLNVGMAFTPGSAIYAVFDFTGLDNLPWQHTLTWLNNVYDGGGAYFINGTQVSGGNLELGFIAEFSAPTVTPVPGAVWLLGSGLFGLVGLRRKMKA